VTVLDLLSLGNDLFLVMDYVQGETFASLLAVQRERGVPLEPAFAVTVVEEVLRGLHAAHVARDEAGRPLHVVHRDVSPQNIMVGLDGVSRILDFGIAKAAGRLQETSTGQVKGKVAYMAPEQLLGGDVDARVDVFAAGVVLWEALANRRLFAADSPGGSVQKVLSGAVPKLSEMGIEVSDELSAIVTRALASQPSERFPSALEFADALEGLRLQAGATSLAEWVRRAGGDALGRRIERLGQIEAGGPPGVALAESEESVASRGGDPDATVSLLHGASRSEPLASEHTEWSLADQEPRGSEVGLDVERSHGRRGGARALVVGGVAVLSVVFFVFQQGPGAEEESPVAESATKMAANHPEGPTATVKERSPQVSAAEPSPGSSQDVVTTVAVPVVTPARPSGVRPSKASAPKPASSTKRAEDMFSRN
jgi:serine/threonine-protein kinase